MDGDRGFPQRGLIKVRFAPKATQCGVAAKRRYANSGPTQLQQIALLLNRVG
jgi:hypothetical protein